jgi:YD repeat-containing protein
LCSASAYNQLYLIRVRDPKLQVYRFDLDNLGRVTRRYDPADTLNRYDSYRYDRDGGLVGWTNRRGQAVGTRTSLLATMSGTVGSVPRFV